MLLCLEILIDIDQLSSSSYFQIGAVLEMFHLQIRIDLFGKMNVVDSIRIIFRYIQTFGILFRSNDDRQFALLRFDGHHHWIELIVDCQEIVMILNESVRPTCSSLEVFTWS